MGGGGMGMGDGGSILWAGTYTGFVRTRVGGDV